MSRILLHKEKGVNPHLTCCSNCGKETGLVLLGASDYVEICEHCKLHAYGGMERKGTCNKCGCGVTRRAVGDLEKFPIGLCDDCTKFYAVANAEARENNAILLRCSKCGFQAVMRGDAELAIAAREYAPEYDHKLMGVEITPEQCPKCSNRPELLPQNYEENSNDATQ